MPNFEELSAAQQASFQVRASLVFLNSPELKDVNLGEKADAVQDFIAENKDNFNNLSTDKLEKFSQSLTELTEGIKKYEDYYTEHPLKNTDIFAKNSLESLKKLETPLTNLGKLIKPQLSKEEIADNNAREQFIASFGAIDQKVAELDTNVRGLSDKAQTSANSIKNGLTSLKNKLGEYFSKNKDDKEEKKEFTEAAKQDLTNDVDELRKKMDEAAKIPEASNEKRAKNIFDSSFLNSITENLAKLQPFKNKNVEVENLGAIVEEKVKEKGDIKVEINDNIKEEIKQDIKEDIKQEVKEQVKEEEKKEEKKEEVKEEKKQEEVKEEKKEEAKKEEAEEVINDEPKAEPKEVKKEEPKEAKKEEPKNAPPQKAKTAPEKHLNYNDLVQIYNRLDKTDSAVIRSSEEFRRTKSALKGALKIYEDNIDPKNREKSIADINKNGLSKDQRKLVSNKLQEAFEYSQMYVEKKGNEVNSSDRAVSRYAAMSEVSESLKKQVNISNKDAGVKTYTNAQAADELIRKAREKYNPDLSDRKKAQILASLRYAEKLKENGNAIFNARKATKDIADNSSMIYWQMQTAPGKKTIDTDKSKKLSERVPPVKNNAVKNKPAVQAPSV